MIKNKGFLYDMITGQKSATNGYWELYIGDKVFREGHFINNKPIGYWKHYRFNINGDSKVHKKEYRII